ncbi:MAG: transcription initiation factor IIB [Thermoproteus sp.]|nr:transcription initiation factor IIB [Thermoproteus sp.]
MIKIFIYLLFVEENKVCPVCGNSEFVYNYERGEIICAVCGAVVTENLVDLGPEWRAIEADEKMARRRTGAPMLVPIAEAFTTRMDQRDALGKDLDLKRKIEAVRLMRWQDRVRSRTSYERSLVEALQEMERLKNLMGLPKPCVERALKLYRQALAKELNKGQPMGAMAAATLYAACRMLKVPRPLDEFAKYAKATKRKIGLCYRLIVGELGLKVPVDDPILHVMRIAGRLRLSSDIAKTAIEILQNAKKVRSLMAGKSPAGIAASALYLAAYLHGVDITQREFAAAADVTEVTIRQGHKKLAEALGIKIPQTKPSIK